LNNNSSRTPLEHYRKLSRTSSQSGIIYKPFVQPPSRHERTNSGISHSRQQPSISETGEDQRSTLTGVTHIRTQTSSSTYSNLPSDLVPQLSLKIDGVSGETVEDELSAQTIKPKSPAGGKISSFFGWRPQQQRSVLDSPSTIFSGRSSPAMSPMFSRRAPEDARPAPSALDIPKANSLAQNGFFNVPGTPLVSNSPGINAHVEELERELQHISTELAESIRREMELEDELDRIRTEVPSLAPTENRRTSDYYSDSGASSVRYPFSDSDTKLDELEKQRRKAEQEKAQIKVDMAQRLQEELRRRRDLEAQVITLEEQLTDDGSKPTGDRTRELETLVEDLRRRLTDERQMKENFEDLLAALKLDLERYRNERDNLHDEVVPQLRARVEGLEGQASEVEKLTYENARMQQELQALKSDNQALLSPRGFNPIAEEGTTEGGAQRLGLNRSNSLARSPSLSKGRGRAGSLSRRNSINIRNETKESLAEQLRDVEEQRDALHKALRNLLDRQEVQSKEHRKRVKALEIELRNALDASPKRKAFHEEVKSLRAEINHLRRRADDALEQKYQCEKGLSGLRMDLDRAEQETASLRDLLKEHDIFVPERKLSNGDLRPNTNSSPTLERSYLALQTTHALSLASIKQMEEGDSLEEAGSEIKRTMQLLKQSISNAQAERDAAIKEAETYRQQARALQKSEMGHLAKEQSLASDLYASAKRMDGLSAKVQQQLDSNKNLRARLAEAISRGEGEQRASAAKIVELERRLKQEEDKLVQAQQQSEEAVSKHEEQVKELRVHTSNQLQRVRSGVFASAPQGGKGSPAMGQSPLFLRSPKLDQTSSGPGMSMSESTKTEFLEKKVSDLERALSDADKEMEEVVGRMNMAQIEVAELQSER
jgi:hypothetical protein